MNTTLAPAFSSSDLQQAIDESRSVLEGADEARNRLSGDIKALEHYFQELDLNASFRFPLSKQLTSDMGHVEEEALLWSPDGGGKFRLLYEVSRWDGGWDEGFPGGLTWDESSLTCETKPLIETKFEVRKRMFVHLASFVTALSNELAVERELVGANPAADDIPF
jgi:hypothetical protein